MKSHSLFMTQIILCLKRAGVGGGVWGGVGGSKNHEYEKVEFPAVGDSSKCIILPPTPGFKEGSLIDLGSQQRGPDFLHPQYPHPQAWDFRTVCMDK